MDPGRGLRGLESVQVPSTLEQKERSRAWRRWFQSSVVEVSPQPKYLPFGATPSHRFFASTLRTDVWTTSQFFARRMLLNNAVTYLTSQAIFRPSLRSGTRRQGPDDEPTGIGYTISSFTSFLIDTRLASCVCLEYDLVFEHCTLCVLLRVVESASLPLFGGCKTLWICSCTVSAFHTHANTVVSYFEPMASFSDSIDSSLSIS